VQASANLKADVPDAIANGARTANGAGWPVEGGKESITRGVDLDALETVEEPPHQGVMFLKQVSPATVTERL